MRQLFSYLALAGISAGLLGVSLPQAASADAYVMTTRSGVETTSPITGTQWQQIKISPLFHADRVVSTPVIIDRAVEQPVVMDQVCEQPVFMETPIEQSVMIDKSFLTAPTTRILESPVVIRNPMNFDFLDFGI